MARKKKARRRGRRHRGSHQDNAPELTFADIVRAKESRAPNFSEILCGYVEQPDPAENRPEEPSLGAAAPELPDDAWTIEKLRNAVSPSAMWGKTPEEEWGLRRGAWKSIMAAPHAPPRLKLADMMLELYATDDAWSRQAVIDIYRNANLGWGLWKGLKSIYKLAEQNYDAEMFGVLACRLDIYGNTSNRKEVGPGTIIYMRRRAWRYLRQLGQAMPEQFPTFACEVLRHYPEEERFWGSKVASCILNYNRPHGRYGACPDKLKFRAFDESWKLSADPLFLLLGAAQNDEICKYAIMALQGDFQDELRQVEPSWLANIASKKLAAVDGFIVELMEATPEFHQSKLAKLGLHDTAVGLLSSDNDKAVRYAIDYCNAHAPKIDPDTLIDLAESGGKAVTAFALARLEKLTGLGMARIVRMLGITATFKLADAKFKTDFKPSDIGVETYVALATGDRSQRNFVAAFYKAAKEPVPTSHLKAHIESDDIGWRDFDNVLAALGKRSADEIGIDWIKAKLLDDRFTSDIVDWLTKGMVKREDMDVDWLKGLVARPSWRELALELLSDTALVAPHMIGSQWLLKSARHSDPSVAQSAHSYLLHHFGPKDFAREQGSEDKSVGVDLVFALLSEEHPAPVRRFAASYLLLHHPELGPRREESRSLGIKPALKSKDYSLQRLRGLLFDPRIDVRSFANKIAKVELIRWKDASLAYDMASCAYRETRVVGAEAVLGIGEPETEKGITPPIKWLDADRAFAMAESPTKATRETALTLIRRHYQAIGSAEKLAWLMDSPDREVRLFAVRLLWEKHRPLAGPRAEEQERFDSNATLQEFVRTVLFGLPPGRMERRDSNAGALAPLPASVAKKHVVDVVRDMGIEDQGFAGVIAPVLEEFLASRAKGEWHSCVAALAQMRAAHPGLETSLPQTGAE